MDNKTISLIVGGSGGIGSAVVRVRSKLDATVCVFGRNGLKKMEEEFKAEGITNCEFYAVDVTQNDSVTTAVKQVLDKHGKINSVLYSVSPPIVNKKYGDSQWDAFQKSLDVHVKGFYFLSKSILKNSASEEKTRFVVILTEYCFGKPPVQISDYITAKYALLGLVKSLASELDSTEYSFNMISPGMVDTPLLSHLPPRFSEIVALKNPMKRIAQPKDVAKLVSFLFSQDADYLNGVNILLNGGNIFQ